MQAARTVDYKSMIDLVCSTLLSQFDLNSTMNEIEAVGQPRSSKVGDNPCLGEFQRFFELPDKPDQRSGQLLQAVAVVPEADTGPDTPAATMGEESFVWPASLDLVGLLYNKVVYLRSEELG